MKRPPSQPKPRVTTYAVIPPNSPEAFAICHAIRDALGNAAFFRNKTFVAAPQPPRRSRKTKTRPVENEE